jgi:hypothetical protein
MAQYAELLALRFDAKRTPHAYYRAMRVLRELVFLCLATSGYTSAFLEDHPPNRDRYAPSGREQRVSRQPVRFRFPATLLDKLL